MSLRGIELKSLSATEICIWKSHHNEEHNKTVQVNDKIAKQDKIEQTTLLLILDVFVIPSSYF